MTQFEGSFSSVENISVDSFFRTLESDYSESHDPHILKYFTNKFKEFCRDNGIEGISRDRQYYASSFIARVIPHSYYVNAYPEEEFLKIGKELIEIFFDPKIDFTVIENLARYHLFSPMLFEDLRSDEPFYIPLIRKIAQHQSIDAFNFKEKLALASDSVFVDFIALIKPQSSFASSAKILKENGLHESYINIFLLVVALQPDHAVLEPFYVNEFATIAKVEDANLREMLLVSRVLTPRLNDVRDRILKGRKISLPFDQGILQRFVDHEEVVEEVFRRYGELPASFKESSNYCTLEKGFLSSRNVGRLLYFNQVSALASASQKQGEFIDLQNLAEGTENLDVFSPLFEMLTETARSLSILGKHLSADQNRVLWKFAENFHHPLKALMMSETLSIASGLIGQNFGGDIEEILEGANEDIEFIEVYEALKRLEPTQQDEVLVVLLLATARLSDPEILQTDLSNIRLYQRIYKFSKEERFDIDASSSFFSSVANALRRQDEEGLSVLLGIAKDKSLETYTNIVINEPTENLIKFYRENFSPTTADLYGLSGNDTVQTETRAIQYRLADFANGFGAFTHFARGVRFVKDGIETRAPSLMSQFGQAAFMRAEMLPPPENNINKAPGNAYILEGLDVAKVFAPEQILKTEAMDFSYWKETFFPDGAEQFDDLEFSTIIMMRGLICLIPRDTLAYALRNDWDITKMSVGYGMVIYNSHFHHEMAPKCMLVPAEILKEHLVRMQDRQMVDMNDFSPLQMIEESIERGMSILYPLSSSCVGGSLSNAFPPASGPYFEFERYESLTSNRLDGFGHLNSSSRSFEYEELLAIAHEKVRVTCQNFIHLMDWFLLAEAQFNKGLSVEGDDGRIQLKQSESDAVIDFVPAKQLLRQIYLIRESLVHNGATQELFPVASIINPRLMSAVPEIDKCLIDLYSMTINIEGRIFSLPQDGDGDGIEEQEVWTKALTDISKSYYDIRLYSRDKIGWD